MLKLSVYFFMTPLFFAVYSTKSVTLGRKSVAIKKRMTRGKLRGYVSRKVLNHPIGHHFNQEGHDITDMIPLPIEKVYPEGDDLLRKRREKLWILRYDAVNFEGANSRE